jgi:hypothetical protein
MILGVDPLDFGATLNQRLGGSRDFVDPCSLDTISLMRSVWVLIATYLYALLLPRHWLALECAALRQQLVVYKRKQPRPRLTPLDRLFWRFLRRIHSDWADLLIVV